MFLYVALKRRQHDGRVRAQQWLSDAIAQNQERNQGGRDPEGGTDGSQIAAWQAVSRRTDTHLDSSVPSLMRFDWCTLRGICSTRQVGYQPNLDSEVDYCAWLRRGQSFATSPNTRRREIFSNLERNTRHNAHASFNARMRTPRRIRWRCHGRGYSILGDGSPSRFLSSFPFILRLSLLHVVIDAEVSCLALESAAELQLLSRVRITSWLRNN